MPSCFPREAAYCENRAHRGPEREHEQVAGVRGDALAVDDRARQAVDQMRQRQHLRKVVDDRWRLVGVES